MLRRPATAADRLSRAFENGAPGRSLVIYVRYIRRARVSDGVSYYLIPQRVSPPTLVIPSRCYAEQRATLRHLVAPLQPAKRTAIMRAATQDLAQQRTSLAGLPTRPADAVEFVIGGGGASCCAYASSLAHYPSIDTHGQTVSGVAPDGVASVQLYYAHTASQDPRTIISKATRTITTAVINNVYAVNVGNIGRPIPAAVVYRSANGAVLKRFNTNQ